jgi:transposase
MLHCVGTTVAIFLAFMVSLLARLPRFPQITFLWDNLDSHGAAPVIAAIYAAGHRVQPRPPYSPQDGPIEYVFNAIELHLENRMYQIKTNADLERHMANIIAYKIGDTDRYFAHCGYTP